MKWKVISVTSVHRTFHAWRHVSQSHYHRRELLSTQRGTEKPESRNPGKQNRRPRQAGYRQNRNCTITLREMKVKIHFIPSFQVILGHAESIVPSYSEFPIFAFTLGNSKTLTEICIQIYSQTDWHGQLLCDTGEVCSSLTLTFFCYHSVSHTLSFYYRNKNKGVLLVSSGCRATTLTTF